MKVPHFKGITYEKIRIIFLVLRMVIMIWKSLILRGYILKENKNQTSCFKHVLTLSRKFLFPTILTTLTNYIQFLVYFWLVVIFFSVLFFNNINIK